MFTSDETLRVYRDLADYHERQGLDQLRDRFLVLAAVAAQTAGQPHDAEQMRQRLLKGNSFHMLRSFTSMAEALNSQDVQNYVEDLRQEYPLHAAVHLLEEVQGPVLPSPHIPLAAPPRQPVRALPPTAPVIDLDNPVEKLKVFSGQVDADVPTLPAWDEQPRRKTSFPAVRPSKLLTTSASTRPATVAVKRTTVLEPPVQPRQAATPQEEPEEIGPRWVGLVLFVIVLAGALYLLAVTLLGPFLH